MVGVCRQCRPGEHDLSRNHARGQRACVQRKKMMHNSAVRRESSVQLAQQGQYLIRPDVLHCSYRVYLVEGLQRVIDGDEVLKTYVEAEVILNITTLLPRKRVPLQGILAPGRQMDVTQHSTPTAAKIQYSFSRRRRYQAKQVISFSALCNFNGIVRIFKVSAGIEHEIPVQEQFIEFI